MKKVLKIFGIVSACVVGFFGILMLCVYLFGNSDDTIYARSINFSKEETVVYKPFSLRVDTLTENGKTDKIKLSVDNGGIIDIPTEVDLGEDFVVWPIKVDGTTDNVGGVVTITANSGTLYCKTKVFVDVECTSIVAQPTGIGAPEEIAGESAYKINQMDKINFTSTVLPKNAINPSLNDVGTNDLQDKEIIYVLYSADGLLDSSVAEFVSGSNSIGNIYSTKSDYNSVAINVKADNGKFYLKAYVYDTYSTQDMVNSYELNLAERLQYMVGYTTNLLDDNTKVTFVIGDNVPSEITSDVSQINGYINTTQRAYFKKATGLTSNDTNLNLGFVSSNPNIDNSDLDVLLKELTISTDEYISAKIYIDSNNLYDSYIEYTTNASCLKNGVNSIINPTITIKYYDLSLDITVNAQVITFAPNIEVGKQITVLSNDSIEKIYQDGRLVVTGNTNASFKLDSYRYFYETSGELVEIGYTDDLTTFGLEGKVTIFAKNVLVAPTGEPITNDGQYIYLGEEFTFELDFA